MPDTTTIPLLPSITHTPTIHMVHLPGLYGSIVVIVRLVYGGKDPVCNCLTIEEGSNVFDVLGAVQGT